MSLVSRRPGALLRFGLHLPTWLYRLHLGWLLGQRFLMLLHTGRTTGRIHCTVVEVVSHEGSLTFYVVSGWGRKADWYRNIHQQPEVQLRVGSRTMKARAEDVPTEKAAGTCRNTRPAIHWPSRSLPNSFWVRRWNLASRLPAAWSR